MIWVILTAGLILRLISLNQSLWLDEAINIIAAQKFSFLGMITEYAQADFHPPGWFIILWFWGKLFGYLEVATRIPSVIFGVVTIYIIYLIGKKLVSKNFGLIVALLLCINPLHIFYSQEARMYSLATLAVSLNMLIFINLVKGEWGKRGNIDKVIYIMSNLLVLVSDYVAYLIFPAQFICLLISKHKEMFVKWFAYLLFVLFIFSWWVPVFISQFNVGNIASANLPAWKFIVGGFDVKNIPLTLVKFIIGRISLANKQVYYILLLPICSLFLFLILKGIKAVKDLNQNLLICWLGIPIILATTISFIVPIYSYFRVLFVLPAFIILVTQGIFSYKSNFKYLFLIGVLLIQIFASSVYLFNSSYQREDWKGLVSYLKESEGNPLILFESSGTLPPFDYYAKNSLNAKGALKDFPAKSDNDLIDLKKPSQTGKDIFLVDYLIDISDPARLVSRKINQLGYTLSETVDFHGVGFIYHFKRE